MTGPTVCGQPAADRLLAHVHWLAPPNDPPISADVVAIILRALADYTALVEAVRWRPDPTDPSPAVSVGRWLHDVADQLRDRQTS